MKIVLLAGLAFTAFAGASVLDIEAYFDDPKRDAGDIVFSD